MSKIFKTKNLIIPLLFALVIVYLSFVITPSSALASTIKSPPSSLGLVGYWPMNEGSGTVAGDASGNGRSGTLTNSPTWTAGKRGNALSFNGASSNYVSMANSSSWDFGTSNFTISLWVKPTSFAGYNGLVSGSVFSGSCQNGWSLYTQTDGVVKLSTNCANSNLVTSVSAMTLNQWNHIVVVRSGTGATDLNIYINSVAGGSPASGNVTISSAGSGIVLGRYYAATLSDHYFDGQLDDARIYNRALSSTEITTLYNSKEAKLGVSQSTNSLATSLVGHWTFDGSKTAWTDATTGTATDSSGNSNTGTFTNMSRSTAPVRGQIGQAIDLDGTNDFISVTTNAGLQDHSNGLSVSFWVKFTSITDEVIISKYDQNSPNINGYVFFLNNSHWYWQLRDGNTCCRGAEAATGPTAGVWYHVILWWDKTNGKAYVNGTEVLTFAASGALTSTGDNLEIGRSNDGANANIAATFDDVRVYSRALTTAERTRLYNLGRPSVVKTTFLLDKVKTAAAAYSVRKLRNAYTGSAMTVRRTSPAGSTNIGYLNGGDLDTASLLTYCASTDCFVSTWYDQSGNGRNITQATEGLQPKIVSSGALITGSNSKPAMTFDGADDYLTATFTLVQPETIYSLINIASWTYNHYVMDGGAYDTMAMYQNGSSPNLRQYSGGDGSGVNLSNFTLGTWGIVVSIFDRSVGGALSMLSLNSASPSGTVSGLQNGGGFTIGTRGNGQASLATNVSAQEVIIYPVAQPIAKSSIILNDQNNYFRVY